MPWIMIGNEYDAQMISNIAAVHMTVHCCGQMGGKEFAGTQSKERNAMGLMIMSNCWVPESCNAPGSICSKQIIACQTLLMDFHVTPAIPPREELDGCSCIPWH